MKTQYINLDRTFLDISNLLITGVKDFNLNKLFSASKFSTEKAGQYLLPLLRQLFRDNFMGSDMEIGILLIFLRDYFLSAADVFRNNAITDRIKKLTATGGRTAILITNNHQQAA
jgi:hypothetical protein